jgi:hypothetical protein
MGFNSYIYLIQEREFINSGENVFKIGRTRQENFERFKNYPKGSKILLHTICNDCDNAERKIKSYFKKIFISRKDYGSEYFEGSYLRMIFEMNKVICELDNDDSKSNISPVGLPMRPERNKSKRAPAFVDKNNEEEIEFEEEYFIDRIVSHRGDLKNLDKIQFKVKWHGYDKSHDSFEPFNNLKETEAMDIYLNSKLTK